MSKTNAGTGEAADRTARFFFPAGCQRWPTTAIAAFFERCGIAAVPSDEGRLAGAPVRGSRVPMCAAGLCRSPA